MLSCSNSFAGLADKTMQLGIYTSNITYTEPSVMQEKGSLFGFIGRFISHENNAFRALEINYSSGYMDYEGSGTIEDIPDEILEIRGLVGSGLTLRSGSKISSYVGLGYRNLNDDSSGMLSSTSASGYEREQIYIYFPIGIEFSRKRLINGWALGGRIEFDYLIKGKNNSYTGSVRGYDDVSFDQYEGYGNRMSMSFSKEFDTGKSMTIEPFYRHWNISESNVTYDSSGRGWIEPYNYSREFGVSLLLTI